MASTFWTSEFQYDYGFTGSSKWFAILQQNHSDSDCEICAATKLIRTSFHPNPKRASKPLELVHTDIAGPMRVFSLINNHRYVINFVDDYGRLIVCYTMKYKSETLQKFKQFIADVGKPDCLEIDLTNPMEDDDSDSSTINKPRTVRSDNGSDYISHAFRNYTQIQDWKTG
jgi:transposase InsO family protein